MTGVDDPAESRGDVAPEERTRRADRWERAADEREQLADERERLADEREALADQRERVADRQEQALDRHEADRAAHATATGAAEDADEAAAAEAAVRRAEAAVQRAQAELDRARQAAARMRARATLRAAHAERAASALDRAAADPEEAVWLAQRRDFVAAEREDQAAERDEMADRREETAGRRERLADARERQLLDREQRLTRPGPGGRHPRAGGEDADRDPAQAKARTAGERERAAAARRAAAGDRMLAAAAWGPQSYGPRLLSSFAPLARQLLANDDLPAALARVSKFAVAAVAGCTGASVTLVRQGRVVDTVGSGPGATDLDDVQFATGIGPAPEAMDGEQPVHVPDLSATRHWPALAAAAAEWGVVSTLSFGLHVRRPAQWSALGALTLYATTPDAFSDDDRDFGSLLAAYLAVAAAAAQRRDEVDRREAALHRALSTRDVIGQAKGILMERRRLSAGEAFDQLRRVSQRLNRRLTDVAQHLAETGEMPQ